MVEERMREKVIFKKKTSSNLIYELLCQASNIATWYEGPMYDLSHLSGEEKRRVAELLDKYDDIFSKDVNDIGHITDFKMSWTKYHILLMLFTPPTMIMVKMMMLQSSPCTQS